MTEYIIHVNSVSSFCGIYKVEYQPIPFLASAIKGHIYLIDVISFGIPFRSSPLLRTTLLGGRELPTFNLLVDSDYVISGCYTPETKRMVLYLPQPPNLLYHWLVISGDEAKVTWIKDGF